MEDSLLFVYMKIWNIIDELCPSIPIVLIYTLSLQVQELHLLFVVLADAFIAFNVYILSG